MLAPLTICIEAHWRNPQCLLIYWQDVADQVCDASHYLRSAYESKFINFYSTQKGLNSFLTVEMTVEGSL